MNEQGCAFVCAIFAVFAAILAGYWLKSGNTDISWIISAFGLVVFLASGLVIAVRHT